MYYDDRMEYNNNLTSIICQARNDEDCAGEMDHGTREMDYALVGV